MTEQKELEGVCQAGQFRKAAFIAGIVANVLVFLLIFFSRHVHPEGKGMIKEHEPRAVAFSAFISIAGPFFVLFGVYFSFKKWGKTSTELMYRWQAWISVLVVIGIFVFVVGYLSYIILFADYHRPPGSGGIQPANPEPAELSFSFRADELFLWVAGFLQVALAMGLLSPSPDAVYLKTTRKPK